MESKSDQLAVESDPTQYVRVTLTPSHRSDKEDHPHALSAPSAASEHALQYSHIDQSIDKSSPDTVQPMIRMNQCLAKAVDLQMQMKQAYWNVKGPEYLGLHELLEKVYQAVSCYVDLIAEYIVAWGGMAREIRLYRCLTYDNACGGVPRESLSQKRNLPSKEKINPGLCYVSPH